MECFIFVLIFCFWAVAGQRHGARPPPINTMKWCVVGQQELEKCHDLARNVEQIVYQLDTSFLIECVEAPGKADCMTMLDKAQADVSVLDPGELFRAGRFHSLIPFLSEVYEGGEDFYYAVAVLKKGSLPYLHQLSDLRDKKACFPSVGSLAGWEIPMAQLLNSGAMPVTDCNNPVATATNFFGESCGVNALQDMYNPLGDNSQKLCQLCAAKDPGIYCSQQDPFANFEGAFECLRHGGGDIAFLKGSTVATLARQRGTTAVSLDDYELLCLDGRRENIRNPRECNWGKVPSHAVVTTSAKSEENIRSYQDFLQKLGEIFGREESATTSTTTVRPFQSNFNNRGFNEQQQQQQQQQRFGNFGNNRFGNQQQQSSNFSFISANSLETDEKNEENREDKPFELFRSLVKYGHTDLLFQDNTQYLRRIPRAKQSYSGYLGEALTFISRSSSCPVGSMTLCVTSPQAMDKCLRMKTALRARLLKPDMVCVRGFNALGCMRMIQNGDADITVLDPGDVYIAGARYDLVPIMVEQYNLATPETYAVAVARQHDSETNLLYLKGKNTCHSAIFSGTSWILPLSFLLNNERIRPYGCDSIRAAAEFFSKSCAPGAVTDDFHFGQTWDNLCDLCRGSSSAFCARDAREDYYGHTGAFKCLVEGGGHVAFVKHTTVMENVNGKRTEMWARNQIEQDFELLCRDGTRQPVSEFEECNIGKTKGNAVVTRGQNETEITAFLNLLMYAQQLYGLKYGDDFSFRMFASDGPEYDLIFQDATQQLVPLAREDRNYLKFLGKEFMLAMKRVNCNSAIKHSASSSSVVLLSLLQVMLLARWFH